VVHRLVGDETLLRTVSESYAGVRVSATWDSLDSIDFPTHGVRATAQWVLLQPWGGSDVDGDTARLALDWAISRGRYHLLLGARLATTPGDETFFQAQNFLGGFLNLSGYNEKALVGNQLGFLRTVAYRRLGDTNQIFSVPTYLGASLEAGNVWNQASDFGRGGFIVGGSVFLGFGTPLGPLFFSYGRNDAGASSFYLTFGSLLRRDGE
jgi:NTE family protein